MVVGVAHADDDGSGEAGTLTRLSALATWSVVQPIAARRASVAGSLFQVGMKVTSMPAFRQTFRYASIRCFAAHCAG